MAVTRVRYQFAHITIVIAYTFFCVAVLGLENPITRFVAAVIAALPIIWAVWTLATARIPAATLTERVREALKRRTEGHPYRRIGDELEAMAGEAQRLLQVTAQVRAGVLAPDVGFQRRGTLEKRMKRHVENIVEAAEL